MTKPTIAVDVDNVLAMHADALMTFYNSVAGTSLTIDDYSEMWRFAGESVDHKKVIGGQFVASGIHARMGVIEGSQQALAQLKSNYKLVIITARKKAVVETTLTWVEQHFPGVFDGIHFAQIWEEEGSKITKADLCRQVGAEYLIDDSLEHCFLVAEAGIETLLFGDYAWNKIKEPLPKCVKRVKDWQEALGYFNGKSRR